jgi:hypothetical protein
LVLELRKVAALLARDSDELLAFIEDLWDLIVNSSNALANAQFGEVEVRRRSQLILSSYKRFRRCTRAIQPLLNVQFDRYLLFVDRRLDGVSWEAAGFDDEPEWLLLLKIPDFVVLAMRKLPLFAALGHEQTRIFFRSSLSKTRI